MNYLQALDEIATGAAAEIKRLQGIINAAKAIADATADPGGDCDYGAVTAALNCDRQFFIDCRKELVDLYDDHIKKS